jgi:hypothetical protein
VAAIIECLRNASQEQRQFDVLSNCRVGRNMHAGLHVGGVNLVCTWIAIVCAGAVPDLWRQCRAIAWRDRYRSTWSGKMTEYGL